MTTTYLPADLSSSTIFQVRFYLGDTDPTDWQLQDEEISWALLERGNTWGATAMCALALAAKYSRLTSISADGVSQGLQMRSEQYNAIAMTYARKEAVYRAVPFVGGVSVSDMYATMSNSDRVPDIFRLGINDDPPNLGVVPVNSPALGSDEPEYDGLL